MNNTLFMPASYRRRDGSPILDTKRKESDIGLLIAFTLIALLAALARGGSMHRLAGTSFRLPWLIFVGLLLQVSAQTVAQPVLEPRLRLWLLLASMGLVALFLSLNVKLPGMGLAAVGLALNVIVIAANGAMPVHAPSAERAGVPISDQEGGVKHEMMDASTRLPWLGDAIALPIMKTVFSLGDVLLALGVALFVYRAARGPSGKRTVREASDSAPVTEP